MCGQAHEAGRDLATGSSNPRFLIIRCNFSPLSGAASHLVAGPKAADLPIDIVLVHVTRLVPGSGGSISS
jgi:hypothetical protein